VSKFERYYGRVLSKQLNFDPLSIARFTGALEKLEGKEFELHLREKVKRVSDDQHGYYRAGIIRTAAQAEIFGGWTEEEIHQYFADMFLGYSYHKKLGNITVERRGTRSTASIGKKEMQQYIEHVISWLALNNIQVKSPDEYFTHEYGSQ